jgi:hypothetical protein
MSIAFIALRQIQGAIRALHRGLGIPAHVLLQECGV